VNDDQIGSSMKVCWSIVRDMRIALPLVGSLFVIACGGSPTPAPASATSAQSAQSAESAESAGPPTTGGTSHLKLTYKGKDYEATGVAMAIPWNGAGLEIQLVSNGSKPAITCERAQFIGLNMDRGTLISLITGRFEGKPGDLKVGAFGYTVQAGSGDATTGSSNEDGSVIKVTAVTPDGFDGTVTGGPVTGELHVKLCPAPKE